MGAWGIGTYQNDSALDFAIDLLETSFEEVYNVERALVWLDVAELFGEVIKPHQYNHIRELIEDDLDNLDNWADDCQEDREQLLLDYLLKLESIDILD